MVRVHAVDLMTDMLGGPHPSGVARRHADDRGGGQGGDRADSRGDPELPVGAGGPHGLSSDPRPLQSLRDYGVGAQILADLGVKDMVLLSNTHRTVVGLEAYGLNIVDQQSIDGVCE